MTFNSGFPHNKIFIKTENTCDPAVETKDIMQLRNVKTYEVVKRVNAEWEYAQHLLRGPFKCSWEKEVKVTSPQEVASEEMDRKLWSGYWCIHFMENPIS